MFTGIIETLASIKKIETSGTNVTFTLSSSITTELKVDQSVAHDGVCLTVTSINQDDYTVTAIDETLQKTNLTSWQVGRKVNLERCMPANGRFDGHIVQGHVDQTAICTAIEDKDGSWIFKFEYDASLGNITVQKGSICVNGTSLTVVESTDNGFTVAIIPYTFDNTVFHQLTVGDVVNLEFDIIGKYLQKIMAKGQ
jgi:riboflavin synthase